MHCKVLVPWFCEYQKTMTNIDQSVENAGVAFVKGASERNEFFEKIY